MFAGDGQLISQWGGILEGAAVPSTMIVGVHRLADETLRLHEYSPGFDPERFAAHEKFFVDDVWRWHALVLELRCRASGPPYLAYRRVELALALELRHPDLYGAVFCASPGSGYRPPNVMPSSIPRAYLVAGTLEPFFRDNASRWEEALRHAGADVVMTERAASHDHRMWRDEFPLMVNWRLDHEASRRSAAPQDFKTSDSRAGASDVPRARRSRQVIWTPTATAGRALLGGK